MTIMQFTDKQTGGRVAISPTGMSAVFEDSDGGVYINVHGIEYHLEENFESIIDQDQLLKLRDGVWVSDAELRDEEEAKQEGPKDRRQNARDQLEAMLNARSQDARAQLGPNARY